MPQIEHRPREETHQVENASNGLREFNSLKEEVDKLLKIKFIRDVHYPLWLANAVLVKKLNDKWMIYMNYIDLNKACLKDSFPLP